MGRCVAVGCSNDSSQGFRMFYFPKKLERRKAWRVRLNRVGWEPTHASRLCQVHFTSSQFIFHASRERLVLRHDAVPELFSHRRLPTIRAPPKPRSFLSITDKLVAAVGLDHAYASFSAIPTDPVSDAVEHLGSSELDGESTNEFTWDPGQVTNSSDPAGLALSPEAEASPFNVEFDVELMSTDWEKYEALLKVKACEERIASLESRLKTMTANNRQLSQKNLLLQSASKCFDPDELECLRKTNLRGYKWTPQVLKKALKIKLACGEKGYETLRQMNYPLPAIRTLQKRGKEVNQYLSSTLM